MLSIHVPVVVNRHSNYMNERWANSNICHSICRDKDGKRIKQFELERFFFEQLKKKTLNSGIFFLFLFRLFVFFFPGNSQFFFITLSLSFVLLLASFNSTNFPLSSLALITVIFAISLSLSLSLFLDTFLLFPSGFRIFHSRSPPTSSKIYQVEWFN